MRFSHASTKSAATEYAEQEAARLRKQLSNQAYDSLLAVDSRDDKEEWLLSYSDMTTLLVVFLVLMFAFADFQQAPVNHPSQQDNQQAISAQPTDTSSAAASETEAGVAPHQETIVGDESPDGDGILPGSRRLAVLEALENLQTNNNFRIGLNQAGVAVHLSERILFDSGQAVLSSEGLALLKQLIPALQTDTFRITVEGHTDDTPIATARFPSNWELSSARASRVVRYFIEQGIEPGRLAAVGYADTRPARLGNKNDDRAANRRVSLRLALPE